MKRIFITGGASSGIGLAIVAHKNGHNAPDKRGGIALEEAGNTAFVMSRGAPRLKVKLAKRRKIGVNKGDYGAFRPSSC
jgi:hypothetical protein